MIITDINGSQRECVETRIDPQYPGFVTVVYASKNRPGDKHVEWYPMEEFMKLNPEVVTVLGGMPNTPKDDLGVVTHAGEMYMEDTKKDWQTNIYVGFYVWISRGEGEAQVRLIKSNSKNTLTIDRVWDKVPNTTSQYVISHNIHDVKILGNELPTINLQKTNQ
ncbi:hypothetical protein KBC75_00495 [Candidatus Shapirobacteria bacterium]|nr:hypothetical protein [Candidatus Shapirobacteria bacterium]